ncbi:hypothetical protein GCM10027160_13440 [Streptomyces calidiresistens]|uniref:Uncharacterized protein n=1 Tax=Streptomyces calidiresistens TaxID=1485586 RepID=A0A7W3XXE9_9ACTN|nr:hypothetical protein [Streptomyces calidiresistens]MBB0230737.1 hypothetical protein [Streptomyces calidiresistens]
MTIRSFTAVPLAVIGAATVVLGSFRPWYGDRLGREIPPAEVFGAVPSPGEAVGAAAGLLPLLIAAATLAVLGLLLRSRLLIGLAGVVGLGLTSMWLGHTYGLENSLLLGGEGLGPGAPLTLLGGGLLVAAAAVMPGPWLVRERTDPLPPVSRPINPRVVAGAWPDGEVPAGVVAAMKRPTGTLSTELTAPLHPAPRGAGGPGDTAPAGTGEPVGTVDGTPRPHP